MDHEFLDDLTDQVARALGRGESLRALALSDQLAAHRPEDALARVLRAHALLATASPEEALRECDVALKLDPQNEDAEFARALAAWRLGHIEQAERAFERAIHLSRNESHFAAQYAWFLASERGPREAAKTAEKVIGASPSLATAWAALGLAQHRLRKSAEAEQTLRHALELDPQSLEAQSAMIRVLKRRGEHRQALALREVLDAARKRYSLFVESADPSARETPDVATLVSRRPWGALRATLMALLLVTLFLALFPKYQWAAVGVTSAGGVLAWMTRRWWF